MNGGMDQGFGFAYSNDQQKYRDERRQDRHPQHGFDVVREPNHEHDREQRADKGSYRIERLAQTIGCTSKLRRCNLGYESITWRTANAFTNATEKACSEHPPNRCGKGKYRLGYGSQSVSNHNQNLSFPEVIADHSRKHLGGRSCCLGKTFNNSNGDHGCAERRSHEYRQEAVNKLR